MNDQRPIFPDPEDLARRVARLFASGKDTHSIAAALCVPESVVADILPAARRLMK